MTKSELIAELSATNPHLRGADVELIVATIFDQITGALARGERVELRGFGAFTVKRAGLPSILSSLPIDAWECSVRVSTMGRVPGPTGCSYAECLLIHEQSHIKHIVGIVGTIQARKGSEDGS